MASSSTTDAMGQASLSAPDGKGAFGVSGRDDQPTVISHLPAVVHPETDLRADRLLAGDRLGHFEVLELIGGGGMARVYRATDTRLSRLVALKVLSREQAADPETLQRFHNEAQSAAQLDHENIARVYYVGEDRGLSFIVFEYIQGTDIRALVEQRGPLPVAEAVSYVLQMAEALSHAASRNVVHRDIKPSNIVITSEGRAKLIDMGLARMHKAMPRGSDLTASGVTLGTFDYISPEQARDPRNADVRSDIYSLGCAFFYMLVGRPPFPEGTVLQKLLQHQADDPPDPRNWRPGLPDELIRVLRRMLAKDPRQRYAEAGELVAELLALAEGVGLQPAALGRTVWITPREQRLSYLERHLPWIAPVAALVCIVLLLDSLWSSSGGTGEGVPPAPAGPRIELGEMPGAPADADARPREPAAPSGSPEGATPAAERPSTTTAPPAPPEGPSAPLLPGGNAKPPDGPAPGSPAPGVPASAADPPRRPSRDAGLQADALRAAVSMAEPVAFGLTADKMDSGISRASAAEGGAAPSPGGASADPDGDRPGIVLVTDRPEGGKSFGSVAAALSAAGSGDVIELRYSGRRQESPIRLANVSLTVRAGEGYRPEIVFRPTAEDKDPVQYPRQMLALTGGELSLYGVALELDVPRDLPADRWSLVEAAPGQTVRLSQCVLTVRNASDQGGAFHPDAAFFRVQPPPDVDAAAAPADAAEARPVVIELSDTVARGEACFLRTENGQPVRAAWNNGLLATTERLLAADGRRRAPSPGETVQIDLRHLTVVARGGLCRLAATEAAPHQIETEIACRDSIVMTAPEGVLIEQSGPVAADSLKQRFRWTGEWNFYEGVSAFWSLRAAEGDSPPAVMALADWQTHWGPQREVLPKLGQVVWRQLPDAARPVHLHAPADYALADAPVANPARRAARDGRDAGFVAEQLPQPPPDPAPPGNTKGG